MGKKSTKALNNVMNENTLTCVLLVVVVGLLIYTMMIYRENFGVIDPVGDTSKLIMFYADWCPHCKDAKPEVEKVKDELELSGNKVNGKKVEVELVNGDEEEEKCRKQNVQGFPTIILLTEGKRKDFNGARDAESIKGFLENNL